MKINLVSCLLLGLLMSCKPAPKTEVKVEESSMTETSPAIPFAGDWLNEKYYDIIQDKKSPRYAQDKVERVFIAIPPRISDTTVMVYGFHESGPDLVAVNKDGHYEMWEVQNNKLDRMAFAVNVVDANHLQLGEDHFVKINTTTGDYNPRILEEILFKGKYQLKSGGEVEFKNNGEVTGLPKYKYYTVLIDYLDAGLDVDQLALGSSWDSMETYGFKMKEKVLDIYLLKCLDYDEKYKQCQRVAFGKLAYSLERKE